jgi:hypothetical protein
MVKRKHLFRGLVIIFLAVLLTLATAVPALAFEQRSGTNVSVGAGEVVNGDLYLFGSNITIDGTVNGDVFAFGQNILLNGTINGGVTAAGQTVTINGKISRGARVAGQSINVTGSIDGDLVSGGTTTNISSSAKIGGDLVVGAQNSTIDGSIGGNIKAASTSVAISNSVGGNVQATGNEITLTSTANIKGDFTYTSKNDARIQTGARIGGTTTHLQPAPSRPARNLYIAGVIGTIVGKVLTFIMLLIIGIILISVLPRKMLRLADGLRRSPVSSLGWGALLLFITPIAAVVVMCTIIGLPLGFISLLLWGIAVYLSEIPVALIIGWLILRGNRSLDSKGIIIGAFALGLFILTVITAIPVIGWIIWAFTAMFGLGTLISSWRGRASIPTTGTPL